jgi:C4-dicarboxylate-binding protein DctP
MAAPSLAKFARFTKAFQIFDLPFLFNDPQHVERFQVSNAGKSILAEMEKAGFVGLDYWSLGMKQLSSNKPMLVPADVKGLKFRVQPADIIQDQMKALGVSSQVLSYAEAYNALQTGVVDGVEFPWANIWSAKFYEVQDGVTETNHGAMGYVLGTSKEFWDGLPDDIRTELRAIIDEVTAHERELAAVKNKTARQAILDAGSPIRTLNAEQRALWVAAMAPVWEKYKGEIGEDLIGAAKNAVN